MSSTRAAGSGGGGPDSGPADPGSTRAVPGSGGTEPSSGATGAASFALVAALMALVSVWTGWGGIALGAVAVVAAVVAVGRVRAGRASGRRRPLAALGLGLIAVTIGTVIEWPTLQSAVTYLHVSQVRTLDECMRQALNEREQRVCKSQHLDEWNQRYPGDTDP